MRGQPANANEGASGLWIEEYSLWHILASNGELPQDEAQRALEAAVAADEFPLVSTFPMFGEQLCLCCTPSPPAGLWSSSEGWLLTLLMKP